jgi:glycolate oxidase FAD binding subunit
VSAVLEEARTLGDQIARELGADRVRTSKETERTAAQTIVEPHSIEEIAAVVRKCEADKITLAPLGAARTLAQIRRTPVQLGVSLARMASIVAYEPDDMTVVAQAGLTLGDLNATLATPGQHLPVDPRDPAATTLGSLVGAAHAGPLRLSEGTVRDLLIGIQFVGHGGRIVRAGGRVVKNVAGYDLMKVMTGSFGTLGIVTEATFKVRPVPANYTLAVATYSDADGAFAAASALHDQVPLIHLEVVSQGASSAFGASAQFLVLAGFGGIRSELDYQSDGIARVLGSTVEMLDGARARELYFSMRDLSFGDEAITARMAVLPHELARCARESSAEFVAHVGSGIAELWMPGDDPRIAARARAVAHSARGHLRIVSAPASFGSQIDFFDHPNPGALKLMQRLKTTFDPADVFNPGCFVGAS